MSLNLSTRGNSNIGLSRFLGRKAGLIFGCRDLELNLTLQKYPAEAYEGSTTLASKGCPNLLHFDPRLTQNNGVRQAVRSRGGL